ncbi:MAG: Do family serine endopeptidase [Rhodospirillales bacterium]|nr:Do family serine endopeptidase [Rhodospirillales bacterium]MCB9973491.1 Do family serine endopeptidase [Rhodospirillales bacterium]MCB9980197.1 Do family serine endopeptidase [Rhodospirillales bacterium]
MSKVGLFVFVLFTSLFGGFSENNGRANAKDLPVSRTQIQLSFAPVVKQVAPAVVNIYTKRVIKQRVHPFMNDPFFAPFFEHQGGGFTRERVQSALGSGVIVDSAGIVVTNEHVINGSDEIIVGLADGREFNARLVLSDGRTDLAVIQITDDVHDLPYAPLRPSESLEVGDLVIAIGNPFGVGQTVTSGIVSALARAAVSINDYNFFIQTDAAINPGNSGGPLVSMDGGVIGINTAIYSRDGGSLGIGFAIPSEMVNSVIAAAKAGKEGVNSVTRPWLGATFQALTPDLAENFGLDHPGGALITGLHAESPLKRAGLGIGDVVIALNGREVHDPAELRFRMATVPLGNSAVLTILQQGKANDIHMTAIAPPETPARNRTVLTGSHPLNGVEVSQINPAVEAELGLQEESGVVISGISDDPSFFQMVTVGDVILNVNGKKILTVKDLQDVLRAESAPKKAWQITFNHQGHPRQVVIR